MLHRVRQFVDAGRLPSDDDWALAEEWVAPELFSIFSRQHPRDVAHAAGCARWLVDRGFTNRDLIVAALLHDIGKGDQRRLDRAAYVLLDAAALTGLAASEASRFAVRRAIGRTRDHSRTGAQRLREAGANARVVQLTLLHHERPGGDAMLKLLQQADAAN